MFSNLVPVRVSRRPSKSLLKTFLTRLKSSDGIALAASSVALTIGLSTHNPGILAFLLLFGLSALLSQQSHRLTKLGLQPAYLFLVCGGAASILAVSMHPAAAQNSGLFNPLQQRANQVLNSAGAGAATQAFTGIFGIMSIIAAIAAISAILVGAFMSSQGHNMRESFMPLAAVVFFYLSSLVAMKMFL